MIEKTVKRLAACAVAAAAASAVLPASAGLVAKWDFNNYDPSNPTATNILAATVGGAGKPCYYVNAGTALVTDGTLGQMYVVAPDYAGSDTAVASAVAGLADGNYAIAIPKYSHIALPIPDAVKNHVWTMKMRFYRANSSFETLFNRNDNTTDGDLFIRDNKNSGTKLANSVGGGKFAGSNNYQTPVSSGAWHTLTISVGEQRWDVYLDETTLCTYKNSGERKNYFADSDEPLKVIDGIGHLLLCADQDGEDGLMYIDYVELYDEASVYEGKLPHYSKAGLTGEWTFPVADPVKATVGRDLVKHTHSGQTVNFTSGTDGVLPGDGYVRAGQYNDFTCYHGLTNNSSYTVVMDVRVPRTPNGTQQWHSLFSANDSLDASVFIQYKNSKLNIRSSGDQTVAMGVGFDEWARVVITYRNGIKKVMYVNGKMNHESTARQDRMKVTKGGHFSLLGDESGEDYEVDISYAAIYDRLLTAAEIAELHSRPLAQRPDESFVPTVAPAGVWEADGNGGLAASKGMPLTAAGNGYTWTRTAATNAATYVADIALPAVQTDGGVLVMNATGVASGIYGTGSTYSGSFTTTTSAGNFLANTTVGTWGYWSENALDRTDSHRVAVVWAASGRVHYYVDGRAWGQICLTNSNSSLLKPTTTMTFLDGLASGVTRLAAYDAPLTPDEVAALGDAATIPSGNAPNAPTLSASIPGEPVKALADTVTFTVSGTHPDGEYVSFAIDFGDGTGDCTSKLVPSGSSVTFAHKYSAVGTMTPRAKVISQNGVESAWTAWATPFEVVSVAVAARDVLLTWPWQQNVYTNRFTIMCEGVKDAEDVTRWDGLEVQYGADYAQRAPMTRVEGNGNTWIYTAHIAIDGADGQVVPYRLGYYGLPLTFDDPADDTSGTVRLWSQDADESFTCAVWGDNQQGGNTYDWGADKYLYVTRLFEHAVARDVDFGISTGDMASNANYANEIRPCILDRTDAIFGRTRPYYVAWGNHDTSNPANKPYFETGAVDEPAYGTSASGNYFLYRGNVLFIFIDHNLMSAAATQTWLADLLATDRARAAKFRILVQHVPFWLECWGGHNSVALLETAKTGGVDMILSGHMHGYERIHKDGIVQLTNGGAGYLDHVNKVDAHYGDATFLGGHKDVPYLWARQKSASERDVLGPAEPVRMGCIHSYGELEVQGGTLTYTAHGFNADGSYIGVFDAFSLTSRTVTASITTSAALSPCADPSTFAPFTGTPVTNAKWKEYKDAVGEAFAFAEGAGGDPVVNVSKNEIRKFLAWLNGSSGTYRLPTLAELETAFGDELRREVAEWTSTVDPISGWCRILGSPACAADGTWCREADKPSIATAGCHANYLGFRLASGLPPAEPAATDAPLAPALAALEAIADPAAVYKWEGGELVDITAEWTNPAANLVYNVPVIFTGEGVVSNLPTAFNVAFNAGLAAPRSTQLVKSGEGVLTVKGPVKGGVCDSEGGWVIASGGPLAFENVVFAGQGAQFRSGDRLLLLKGDNDFSGADVFLNGTNDNCTNYVAASAQATFRARRMTNKGANPFGVGENLSLLLSKDIRFGGGYTMHVDGSLDAEAFNMFANNDPWLFGTGTLRVGYFGTYDHSWIRLAASNAVFTTARPLRSNHAKSYQPFFVAGDGVRLSSTCDWEIGAKDNFGKPVYILANTTYAARPKLVVEGAHDAVYAPTASVGSYDTTSDFTAPWDVEMAGTGTLTVKTPTRGDIAVMSGQVKISALPCAGATSTSGTGKWAIDDRLSLAAGQVVHGAFASGGELFYDFGENAAGEYVVLAGCGLSEGDITVTTSVDGDARYAVSRAWTGGNLTLTLVPANARIAEWTAGGAAGNPLDAANWRVTDGAGTEIPGAVPNASTLIRLAGATSLSFPQTAGFTYAGLMLADDIALAADCDWSGLGAIPFRDGTFIDLLGHRLVVAGLSGATAGMAGVTDSTNDADHPGELHVRVAEGVALTNATLVLSGNLKFVKEGPGTFVSFRAQTYTGGTRVAEGTAQPPDGSGTDTTYSGDSFKAFGTAPIAVASNAVFDVRGNYAYYGRRNGVCFMRLDGGTLQNGNADMTKSGWGGSGFGALTADSSLNVTRSMVFEGGTCDLDGHTLTVTLGSGRQWYIRSTSFSGGGRIVTQPTGWLRTVTAVDASTVDFKVNSALYLDGQLDVRDYEALWSGTGNNRGSAPLNVHGAFRPSAHDCFYGCTMMDGSTIDLTNRTTPLPLTSAFTDTGLKTLSFASGATVRVKVNGKAFPGNVVKVISWETQPENVTFVSAEGGRVRAESDGLYLVKGGTAIIIR